MYSEKALKSRVVNWLMLVVSILVLAGCQGVAPSGDHEVPADFRRPMELSELVEQSDIVVIGTVSASPEGRQVGPEGEPQVQFVATELKADRVLAGDENVREVVIETEARGVPYNREWRRPDVEVVAFLVEKKRDPGFYRPLGYETILMIDGQDLRETVTDSDWNLVSDMAAMSKRDLAARVREASRRS